MLIDQDYPSPYNLKKLEFDTFNYLRQFTIFASEPAFSILYQDVNLFYYKISTIENLYNLNLNFESHIEYKNYMNSDLLFILSFTINGREKKARKKQSSQKEFDLVTYSLTICKINDKIAKPIRRYHFDYAIKRINQPGPVFHFQFPGKLSPYVSQIGVDCTNYDQRFESWLETPRFNYFPMSFAFLLDIIFTEFPTLTTNKIKNDSRWLSILNKNEEKLLKPYINLCQSYFKSSSAKKLFTRNFCYGID